MINDLQAKTIKEISKLLSNTHYIDLIIRVNGEDKRFQADWIKDLIILFEREQKILGFPNNNL